MHFCTLRLYRAGLRTNAGPHGQFKEQLVSGHERSSQRVAQPSTRETRQTHCRKLSVTTDVCVSITCTKSENPVPFSLIYLTIGAFSLSLHGQNVVFTEIIVVFDVVRGTHARARRMTNSKVEQRLKKVEQDVDAVASAVARPIVKDVTLRTTWRITCSDTKAECTAELVVGAALLFGLFSLLTWVAALVCRRHVGRRRNRDGAHDRLVEAEEGQAGEVLDEEEFGLHRTGAATRPMDASSTSLDTLEDRADDTRRPLTRVSKKGRRSGHRRSGSGGDDLDIDDYAPLSAVKAWLKDVVPEVPHVQMAAEVAATVMAQEMMAVSTAVSKAVAADASAAPPGDPLDDDEEESTFPACPLPEPSSEAMERERPHSSLHAVTIAWRALLADVEASARSSGSADAAVDALLLAGHALLHSCHRA